MKLIAPGTKIKRWRKQDWSDWDLTKMTKVICEGSGKVCYETEEEAEEIRVSQEAISQHPLRIYNNCEHCDHWHMTKKALY